MLSEEARERLTEKLVSRIEELNLYFIRKIGEQIKTVGKVVPSQVRELLQSVKYGNDIDEIMMKIAEVTNMNVNDIYKIFEEVAKETQGYAKPFYDYRKIKYIPYDQNIALQNQVKAIALATANEYVNLSNTFAYVTVNENGKKELTKLSEIYQNITDKAILSVAQGRDTFETSMKKAMLEMTSNGLKTVDYSTGYSRRADTAVRMNLNDGLNRLNNAIQENFAKEYAADGVEIVHHKNSAPDHIDTVDGKQFSLHGDVEVKGVKYKDFDTINDKLKRHVGELNCYHAKRYIILGIDEPLYSMETVEADKKANMNGFDFEGKHYTLYEGTQLQRRIETKIRDYKDRRFGAEEINDIEEVANCDEKIRQLSDKYYNLCTTSGLPTKLERFRVHNKVSRREVKKKTIELKSTVNNKIDSNYKDVTKKWLKTAHPNSHKIEDRQYFEHEGIKYEVDGKNVVLDYSLKEKEIAEWLENTFGGEIYMLPRINNPEGIQTADYLFRGEYWDLKEINGIGKNILFHAIEDHKKQSHNFIFDISRTTLTDNEIIERLNKLYSIKKVDWLDKIIVKRNEKIVKIIKRSDPSD